MTNKLEAAKIAEAKASNEPLDLIVLIQSTFNNASSGYCALENVKTYLLEQL